MIEGSNMFKPDESFSLKILIVKKINVKMQ
jgi:hypothetical protein